VLLFLSLASAWFIVENVAWQAAPPPANSEGPQHLELGMGVAILLTFWVCVFEGIRSGADYPAASALLGAALMGAGTTLRFLAIRTLGASFLNGVSLWPDQPLVTDGVYRAVRHPSETGTICLALGAAMLLGSLAGMVLCLLLLLPLSIRRTRCEDEVLRRHHPITFSLYEHRVGAFLPRI
jgi:protein-S-isoprenylcysteine O-methyltransferase Ste14